MPVGELLDALDQTVRTPDGRLPRESVLQRHPLQPFDAGNFRPVGGRQPFSFDRAALRGARAAAGERSDGLAVYPPDPLPSRDTSQVALAAPGRRR